MKINWFESVYGLGIMKISLWWLIRRNLWAINDKRVREMAGDVTHRPLIRIDLIERRQFGKAKQQRVAQVANNRR